MVTAGDTAVVPWPAKGSATQGWTAESGTEPESYRHKCGLRVRAIRVQRAKGGLEHEP